MHAGNMAGIDAAKIKIDLMSTVLIEVGEIEHVGGVWVSIDMFS